MDKNKVTIELDRRSARELLASLQFDYEDAYVSFEGALDADDFVLQDITLDAMIRCRRIIKVLESALGSDS